MKGIYQIKNKTNNKIYIGSSKHIERRWKEHLYLLEIQKHHSCKLQRAYNKTYDKNNFDFSILEECEDSMLKVREQYYIDLYNSYLKGYNCTPNADGGSSFYNGYKKQYKTEKKKQLQESYEKFMDLFLELKERVIIGKKLEWRLIEKEYSKHVYMKKIFILEWFKENYSQEDYKIHIYYIAKKILAFAIIHKEEYMMGYSIFKTTKRKEIKFMVKPYADYKNQIILD